VPFAPVNSFEEALDDPHIRALGIAERAETSGTHTGAVIKSPILLDGRRPTAIRPAPLLGEHTAEVCEAAGASP
jgi:crotonobetainyl-CoA:carnitine CoA-transferase CaiB-like acyl-CoA transferase